MIEKDLAKLIARDDGADLRRLERDVWHREAAMRAIAGASRRLASAQGLVLAMAIITSASIGVSSAMVLSRHEGPSLLTAGENLAPSSILFGSER